ncbi:MAG: GrdX family protein [Defluviitaleaceae bacterium]|nr:GrdX family protein [Defluviitaleaceae bacterium]MCL2238622.1 GrdX family protein [Defluviitaleaceae bacterium]
MECARIFTNNPAVGAAYPDATHWVEGNVRDVFVAVRDAVHRGARLLSHPLCGSVKPWESPYRSVWVLARQGALDFASLRLIEGAMAVSGRPWPHHAHYDASIREDYQLIDLELMKSAIKNSDK